MNEVDSLLRCLAWLGGDDVGASSRSLCLKLAGVDGGPADVPSDDDDFGRCYRMLRACPHLRDRLDEARMLSPAWARLIDAWSELEALHESGQTKRLYRRLQDLVWGQP